MFFNVYVYDILGNGSNKFKNYKVQEGIEIKSIKEILSDLHRAQGRHFQTQNLKNPNSKFEK